MISHRLSVRLRTRKQLNSIYREVIRVTGVSPDTYRDYQIERTLPGLHDELVAVRAQLDNAITQHSRTHRKEIGQGDSASYNEGQLDDLIKDGDYS